MAATTLAPVRHGDSNTKLNWVASLSPLFFSFFFFVLLGTSPHQ
jgi:hypothetical protein